MSKQYYRFGDNPPVIMEDYMNAGRLIGQYREPKKGEWYVSGCKNHEACYKAPNDLPMKHHIVKLVFIKKKKVYNLY